MSPTSSVRAVDRPRRRLQPEELRAPLELMTGEQPAVGPPLHREHGAGKVDRHIGSSSRRQIPDGRAFEVAELARERQPLIAGDGRPGGGLQVVTVAGDVAHRGARLGVEDPERGVQDVAVLAVPDARQGPVGRQTAPGPGLEAPHPGRSREGRELAGGAVGLDQIHAVGAVHLDAERAPAGLERQPRQPALGHLGEHRLGGAARERDRDERAALRRRSVSRHQATRPSGKTQSDSTPTGSSLNRRQEPSARSWPHACQDPSWLPTMARRSGASSIHAGNPSVGAVNLRIQSGVCASSSGMAATLRGGPSALPVPVAAGYHR